MPVRSHIGIFGLFYKPIGMARVPPLCHESAVVGDCHVNGLFSGEETRAGITPGRGGEQTDTVPVPLGKSDFLPFSTDCDRTGRVLQVKTYTVLDQAGRQQFGRIGMAVAVDIPVGPEGIVGCGVQAERKRHRCLLHSVVRLGSQAYQESLDSPGADVEAELVPDSRGWM